MSIHIKTTVQLPYPSGLPGDLATNTFYFSTANDEPDEAQWSALINNVVAFYNTAQGTDAAPLGAFMSEYISRSQCSVRNAPYDPVTGDEIGDAFVVPFTLAASSDSQDLPLEVAICCSFYSDNPLILDRPAARRRGRVFLGPLVVSANESVVDGTPPLVNGNLLTYIAHNCEALMYQMTDDAWTWEIYSRTNRELYNVTGGWIDNDFDTIRSRGAEASVRRSWHAI